MPVNVLDDPRLCDFHAPAIVDRGSIVVAIGTAGASPILAAMVRTDIEALLAPGLGDLAGLLGDRRDAIRAAYPDLGRRRAFLRRVIAGPIIALAQVDPLAAGAALDDALRAPAAEEPGLVSLIVAPKDPDRISLRALRALAAADILAAPPMCAALTALARRDAERIPLTGARAEQLARMALEGRRVVVVLCGSARALAARLAAAGAAVEIHRPAPASL